MNFAVIENGIVSNIIVADSLLIAKEVTGLDCVQFDDSNPAHIGYGYANGIFEQPIYVAPEIPENITIKE